MKRIVAIVPAAGSSSRMGEVTAEHGSKLLLPLGDETVLGRTLRQLTQETAVAEIIVPTVQEIEAAEPSLRRSLPEGVSLTFIQGGSSRAESVSNALLFLLDRIEQNAESIEDVLVLVHDAARCLVNSEIVRDCVDAAAEFGAVTAAAPCTDTIKRVDGSLKVTETLVRNELWAIQTPQVFRMDLLVDAHMKAKQRGEHAAATDDAVLVEAISSVHVVPSSKGNIKITTPEDYRYLCYLEQNN